MAEGLKIDALCWPVVKHGSCPSSGTQLKSLASHYSSSPCLFSEGQFVAWRRSRQPGFGSKLRLPAAGVGTRPVSLGVPLPAVQCSEQYSVSNALPSMPPSELGTFLCRHLQKQSLPGVGWPTKAGMENAPWPPWRIPHYLLGSAAPKD